MQLLIDWDFTISLIGFDRCYAAGRNAGTAKNRIVQVYRGKLVAIYEGIQIYPVYSVEACHTAFYPGCFGTAIFRSTSELFHLFSAELDPAFYISAP